MQQIIVPWLSGTFGKGADLHFGPTRLNQMVGLKPKKGRLQFSLLLLKVQNIVQGCY
jgi:hypothetical protein